MPDEPKFTLTLTGPQMDFLGGLTVTTLNAANAQAKVAAEVYQLMKMAVVPKTNGLGAHQGLQAVPEVEVDVSPRSPIP